LPSPAIGTAAATASFVLPEVLPDPDRAAARPGEVDAPPVDVVLLAREADERVDLVRVGAEPAGDVTALVLRSEHDERAAFRPAVLPDQPRYGREQQQLEVALAAVAVLARPVEVEQQGPPLSVAVPGREVFDVPVARALDRPERTHGQPLRRRPGGQDLVIVAVPRARRRDEQHGGQECRQRSHVGQVWPNVWLTSTGTTRRSTQGAPMHAAFISIELGFSTYSEGVTLASQNAQLGDPGACRRR
jgi:hypothetical protein